MQKALFGLSLFLFSFILSCDNQIIDSDLARTGGDSSESSGVPFFLSAFQIALEGYESEGGAGWVQVTVNDDTKLKGAWKIRAASGSSDCIVLFDSLDCETLSWNLRTGDRIRLHPLSGYSGPDDRTAVSCGEDNEYDFVFEKGAPSGKSGVLWIEDGEGNVCDFVCYSNNENTESLIKSKPYSEISDGQKALQSAVSLGEWSSFDDVFSYNPSVGYAHISYSVINADSPSDWQCLTGSSICWETYVTLDSFTAAPQVVTQGDPVTISAELRTFHGAAVNAVWFDFYSPESGCIPPAQRIAENFNGVYSYLFDTSSYPAGTWYVSIYVDSDYAEIQGETSFIVNR